MNYCSACGKTYSNFFQHKKSLKHQENLKYPPLFSKDLNNNIIIKKVERNLTKRIGSSRL